MSITLENERKFGGITVAALVDTDVTALAFGSGGVVTGHKYPVAFLFRKDGTTWACRPDGTALSQHEVHLLCPDAWERFGQGG